MTRPPSPHDIERFANAELVAASADLDRCREREIEASKAYIEAMDARRDQRGDYPASIVGKPVGRRVSPLSGRITNLVLIVMGIIVFLNIIAVAVFVLFVVSQGEWPLP